MGPITSLLLAPIAAPLWGFRLLAEKLHDEADGVMHDEARGFAELIELSMHRSAGRISDTEFAEQEAEILDRLASMREYADEWPDDEVEFADAELDEPVEEDA